MVREVGGVEVWAQTEKDSITSSWQQAIFIFIIKFKIGRKDSLSKITAG
jgi:hypothetical protein